MFSSRSTISSATLMTSAVGSVLHQRAQGLRALERVRPPRRCGAGHLPLEAADGGVTMRMHQPRDA